MTAPAVEVIAHLDFTPDYCCEHPHHAEDTGHSHDEEPATHWAITDHPCFGPVGVPYPVCETYSFEGTKPRNGTCAWCGEVTPGETSIKVIGRIERCH